MLANLTEMERQDLLLSIGTHKSSRRIGPARVAELLSKALAGQSLGDIAQDLELRDASVLRRFLSLQKLPEPVRALVSWGRQPGFLSFSAASELARLGDTGLQDILPVCRAAIENEFSKEEIRAVVQRVIRGRVSTEQALDEIIKLRPRIVRQYMFVAKLPRSLLAVTDYADRRVKARQVLAKEFGSAHLLAVSTTPSSLTFVVDQPGYDKNDSLSSLTPQSIDDWMERVFSRNTPA